MAKAEKPNIIDVDIHERADTKDLLPHLDSKFRHYIEQAGWVPDRALPFAQLTVGGLDRADAKTPDGRPGGSDLGLMREQLLDEYDHEYGILTGWLNAGALHPGWSEFKTALMSAYNDWQVENWLDKEDRLVGSININPYDPQGAVREIERLASHPKMVQVMMYIGPSRPTASPSTTPSTRPRPETTSSSRSTTAKTPPPRSASTATSSSGTRPCRRSSCPRL